MRNYLFGNRMRGALTVCLLLLSWGSAAHAADLTGAYAWNPVSIGAGGFVTGFVTHPLNPNVRYCRTDVGNSYRWDNTAAAWIPMIARNADGSGVPASIALSPGNAGCEEIAVDPSNVNTVYMSFPIGYSQDTGTPSVTNTVYKSTDGGKNFTSTPLFVTGGPNGDWRTYSERMKVDPNNGNVLYYGSLQNGLWRSTNAGASWTNVTTGGVPGATSNVINFAFYKSGGTVSAFGLTVSKVMYCDVAPATWNATPAGDVYRSADGGQTWTNISAGTGLSTAPLKMTMDQNGNLWVVNRLSNLVWKYTNAGVWSSVPTGVNGFANNVTVDPNNASRLFAMGAGGDLSRSLDGGATWTLLEGSILFGNTLGWLPSPFTGWRSNSGIYFDAGSVLWCPMGNEGMLTFAPTANNSESPANPPHWNIVSQGIEELVTHDVIIPKSSGDKAFLATEDETGIIVSNPATYTATWPNLQTKALSNCEGVSWCPNAPAFVAYSTYDAYQGSGNNSGYSSDNGVTWTRFATPPGAFGGSIAISRRGAWGLGSDHMVILPDNAGMPVYTKDGGHTWTAATTFPVAGGGYWIFALKQRQLRADPFVADKYYCKSTYGPFSVSTDGGVNWTSPSAALPGFTHNGDIEVNFNVQNDLWYADGWGGADSHGVWHSTDDGTTWTKSTFFDNAITMTLGAGSGVGGDAPYTVYVDGKMTGDSNWGIFRSTNGGTSWDRIAYYPAGVFDEPTALAASWDTYGLVYVTFSGNTAVYGKLAGTTVPNAPTGLTATAGNTQVALSWSASTGATSYSVYRGTTAGGENATAIATGIGTTSYTNSGLTNGTVYYYKVKATNSFGTSGYSNEASATPAIQTPPAPNGLMALGGDTQVSLTWVASTGATTYNVYRGTSAGGEAGTAIATGIAATSYANTGLANGTTYYYKVAGVNSAGTGAQSIEAGAKPLAANAQIAFASSAPTIDGTVDAVWSGATSYPMPNVTGTIPGGATNTGSWQALWDATNLYVLVSMQDSTVLANNDSIEIYIDGNNAKAGSYTSVDWQWVFTNGAGIQEYSAGGLGSNTTGMTQGQAAIAGGWRMECKIPWSTIGVSAFASDNIGLDVAYNNYNVAGTRANKLFWFSTADNDWINPNLFGTAKLMPGSVSPPAAPTGLTATPGNTQVVLSWNASTGATSYNVKRSTVNGSGYVTISSPATTSYTNTGLTNGTTYYYVVTATNFGGTSANSTQVSATPAASVDNAQYNFEAGIQGAVVSGGITSGVATSTARAYLGTQSLAVNFNGTAAGMANVEIDGPTTPAGAVITFHVWIPTGGNVTEVDAYTQGPGPAYTWTSNPYMLASLTAGAWNTLTVTVPATCTPPQSKLGVLIYTAGAWTGTCYIDSISWPTGSPPPAPTGLTATPGNAQVALAWTASSGATSYNALRSTVSGSGYASVATGVATTSYTNTGLTNGTTYYFVVAAKNAGGTSANSAQASATPVADGAQYNFEAGIQGAVVSGGITSGIATSTTQAYHGTHSLAVTFNGAAAGMANVEIDGPTTPAGSVITFHVWIPAGSLVTEVDPYVQGPGPNYTWTNGQYLIANLTAGAWNTLTVTVPTTCNPPQSKLGILIDTSAAWNGICYVDSISW